MDLTLMWRSFTMFGDIQYWVGLVVGSALVYLLVSRKSKDRMAWVVFSLIPAAIFSSLFSSVLKLWFQVLRPCVDMVGCPTTYSFPSNHAAVMFAFAVVASLNVRKWYVWAGTAALAIMVSLSRVFLLYHTPVDIAAGAAVGMFSGLLIQQAYKNFHCLDKSSKRSLFGFWRR